ncbi:MAG: transcription elongation factor GreA [Bacilli bacterium]|nr:transcription elongation factor GreA [Bacilli bacterium]
MSVTKEIVLTKEGLEKLNAEYRNLIDVERPAVIEALQNARAMGDLSENADYDAARNKQAEIEGRIKEIEHILASVKIVDETKKGKTIQLSSVVTYLDLDLDKEFTVKIVSSIESDPVSDSKNLKISNDCPLGLALLGHKAGDEVTVKAITPYDIKIVSFK